MSLLPSLPGTLTHTKVPQNDCNFTVTITAGSGVTAGGGSNFALAAIFGDSDGNANPMAIRSGCTATPVDQNGGTVGVWLDGSPAEVVLYPTAAFTSGKSYSYTIRCGNN